MLALDVRAQPVGRESLQTDAILAGQRERALLKATRRGRRDQRGPLRVEARITHQRQRVRIVHREDGVDHPRARIRRSQPIQSAGFFSAGDRGAALNRHIQIGPR